MSQGSGLKPGVRVRLSIPAAGSTVAAASEARAVFVRSAAAVLAEDLCQQPDVTAAWARLLGSRWRGIAPRDGATAAVWAAWGLVAVRMVGRLSGAIDQGDGLEQAEQWFCGTGSATGLARLVGQSAERAAVRSLEQLRYDQDLRDLLPYVLDAHGPGSRASVLRDPSTKTARAAKRAAGVFYTPADVAEYIVREAKAGLGAHEKPLLYLDPACGTGVFLKAALDLEFAESPGLDRLAFAESALFGLDIDPLAIQAACFVLLTETLVGQAVGVAPWVIWHKLRCNFAVADSISLEVGGGSQEASLALATLRTDIRRSYVDPAAASSAGRGGASLFETSVGLGDLFPDLRAGADLVVGNPPYAEIGLREDEALLQERFASFRRGTAWGGDLFPLFVEMMWRFTKVGHSAAGMVLPLALAYHGGRQMTACRRAVAASGGLWRFAFFDREPHALFGEDVKTRNAIAFRRESAADPSRGSPATIETGPLRKWSSRQRARLFREIDFTRLEYAEIGSGIPKLAGPDFSHAFAVLQRMPCRMQTMWSRAGTCLPAAAMDGPENSVYVASTAYNFLNVMRPHIKLPELRFPWSENPLLHLEFATRDQADRAFAILSSRVVYWLWHVLGDGFHVTRSFVAEVPFADGLFKGRQGGLLTELGRSLWDGLQAHQIVSINGGRQSVAYRPHALGAVRDRIDAALLEATGLGTEFGQKLKEFVRSVIVVDGLDGRPRREMHDQISEDAQS